MNLVGLACLLVLGYAVALVLDYRESKRLQEEHERLNKIDKYCDEDENDW